MSVRDTVRRSKPTIVTFPLPNGESIWVRAFSGPGRAAYSAYVSDLGKEGRGAAPEIVAAMAICEEDGSLAYDWQKPEDLAEIAGHFDAHMLDEIGLKLFELSGLTKKAVDDAEKK